MRLKIDPLSYDNAWQCGSCFTNASPDYYRARFSVKAGDYLCTFRIKML